MAGLLCDAAPRTLRRRARLASLWRWESHRWETAGTDTTCSVTAQYHWIQAWSLPTPLCSIEFLGIKSYRASSGLHPLAPSLEHLVLGFGRQLPGALPNLRSRAADPKPETQHDHYEVFCLIKRISFL